MHVFSKIAETATGSLQFGQRLVDYCDMMPFVPARPHMLSILVSWTLPIKKHASILCLESMMKC